MGGLILNHHDRRDIDMARKGIAGSGLAAYRHDLRSLLLGSIIDNSTAVATCVGDRLRYGLAETEGPLDREVVFVLDGVGGFQLAPLALRRALRTPESAVGSVLFRWQTAVPGEFLTDLMQLRRNRLMGLQLARRILAFRRCHPQTVLHLVAFSGGVGVAVFACEWLRGRGGLETFIMACPALSPEYNLAPALRSVVRSYALVSHRDWLILGIGTRVLGTMDRRFSRAAGYVGFRIPTNITSDQIGRYNRLRFIRWTPALKAVGHHGGHFAWARPPFLREHLLPLLRGKPKLAAERVKPA